MSRVVALTSAGRSQMPRCCDDCVFWQTLRGVTSRGRKDAWTHRVEERFGPWGRALYDGERFLGLLQYGPSAEFPRATVLPAGPPAADGALITCSYLESTDAAGVLERLLLEALADLQARQFATVDAFSIEAGALPDGAREMHHTLFDRQVLERLGFERVRRRGPVALMRIRLGGLERAPSRRGAIGVPSVLPAAKPA